MRIANLCRMLSAGTVVVGFALALNIVRGGEITVVWPSEYESTEAPDGGSGGSSATGSRNQWLIPNDAFSQLPTTHQQLIGFNWRPDGILGQAGSTTFDVKIQLSTTSTSSLSDTFAENFGDDVTVVYDGPITMSTMDSGPAGGPKDFDIAVRFQTPFMNVVRARTPTRLLNLSFLETVIPIPAILPWSRNVDGFRTISSADSPMARSGSRNS